MQEVIANPSDSEQKRAKLLSQYKKQQSSPNPVQARATPGLAPLSNAQEPVWLLSQLEPGNPVYNVGGAAEFNGVLNRAALAQSLNEVIRRHEILRSGFIREIEGIVQRVADFEPIPVRVLDLSALNGTMASTCMQSSADSFLRLPFDLGLPGQIRAMLVRFSPQKHVLLLALHHIIADRWSVNVLMQEIAALYLDFGAGHPSGLPELEIHYGDYASWQRNEQADGGNQFAYWQQKLSNPPSLLPLPADYPRPAVPSYRGGMYHFQLSTGLSRSIKQLSRHTNSSLFMVLAAALNCLLHRYSGSRDIAIGYTAAGRQQAQTANLIGFFVNTLVLRNQISDSQTFSEVLQQVREQALADQDHQDISYGQLLEAAKLIGSHQRTPLFQVMLTVQNAPPVELNLPGLAVSPVFLENRVAQFDLTFLVEEIDEHLHIAIEYNSDIFRAGTAARIAGHLEILLSGIVKQTDWPLYRYPLMAEAEWNRVSGGWNPAGSQVSNQLPATVLGLISEQARRVPENAALIFNGIEFSYQTLDVRSNQLAQHLIELGAGPETRIGLCSERSPELIIGLLAILKAGAAYVPLDPAYPQARLDYMADDAGVRMLLSQAALDGRFSAKNLIHIDLNGNYTNYAGYAPAVPVGSNNTAYIIYTSGSTGQPKGVSVSHGNLRHSTLARQMYYQTPPASYLLLSSFAFDSSVAGIFWTLGSGGSLCLPSTEAAADPAALRALIKRHRVSHLLALPAFYSAIALGNAVDGLESLTQVIVAGEACPSELANEHHRRYPDVKLYNEYGPTEASVWSTVYESTGPETLPVLPIGSAIPRSSVYVLDARQQPVPIGVAGELCIGGLGVTQGYIDRPALTAEQFIPDPFAGGGSRLYRSGDLVRWLSDGNLEFLGRIDQQIKIRGYRIELGEIEAKLLAFSGVRNAVVIAREDASGNKRLVAYLDAADTLDLSGLRNHLATQLPEFMLPSAFVRLDGFPLTPNGKLDRDALPAPEQKSEPAGDFIVPHTLAEIALAELWQLLLGVEAVGRYDHFFELGGHSLMAISLIEQLQQKGYEADVINIFANPVLADMAASLVPVGLEADCAFPESFIPEGCTRITPDLLPLAELEQNRIDALVDGLPSGIANVEDIYALAPLQEGILFHHLLNPEHDTYVKRAVLRFKSRGSLDNFLRALQTVIDRHAILRTSFHWRGLPAPVQVVHRKVLLPVVEMDLADTGDSYRALLQQTDPQQIAIDLQQAPLFKAFIAAEEPGGHWLLSLLNHHLVDDNYTLQLILSEIDLILNGQQSRLPASVPYRNLIAQIRRTPVCEHETFFRDMLGGVEEPTAPFGILQVLENTQCVNEAKIQLETALAQRIHQCAREFSTTPAVLFHTAWALVLAQCSNKDDVVFGTVLYGRLQAGVSNGNALGVYINTLPVRIQLRKLNVRQILAEAAQRLGELLNHEQASLAQAQRCSGVEASLPLFSSLLNYRHSNLLADDMAQLFGWEDAEVLLTEDRTNYPITCSVDDFGDSFGMTLQCVEGIDPERLAGYLKTAVTGLVQALTEAPEQRLDQLSILPQAEYQQLTTGFNATEAEYPQDLCLHQLFEAQVVKNPDAVAVSFEGEHLSYGALNRRANRLAHRLIDLGVQPDSRVGLCAERSLELVVGILGILKAGGAYVPLDPSYPKARLEYLLADSAPTVLVAQAGILDWADTLTLPVVVLDSRLSEADGLWDTNPDARQLGLTPEHLAYIIYTSGSTGLPKGVMASHANVSRLMAAQSTVEHFSFSAADVWALFHSFAFDFSVWELWGALSQGARLVVVPYATSRSPSDFNRLIGEQQITVLSQTPSAYRALLEAQSQNPRGQSLRCVVLGGEALEPGLLAKAREHAPNAIIRYINGYGPTETTIFATAYGCPSEPENNIPIGYPIANSQLYVLDAQLNPVPIGVTGELYIGGAGLARGYLNRPELTAERFIANPFSADGSRLYQTGDLARWRPEGSLDYLGRNDFQVKIRGFRIELGEIEAQLQRCDGVRNAVVLAQGEGEGKRLVAYVVPKAGAELHPEALRQTLSTTLADYLIPSAFVILDNLPLTANGKLDRKALPEPDAGAVISRVYAAPLPGTETVLAAIWQDLLHLEQVGRHDQFFELGGHSLLAVQLIARVRQALGVELPLRELFNHPVLSELAQVVRTAQASTLPAITPADRSRPMPLSWAQQRLWFLAQLDPDASLAYHMPAGLRLQGRLDQAALRAALDRLIARHESLRTRFTSQDGEARQRIDPPHAFTLAEYDLSGISDTEQNRCLAQHSQAEMNQHFDLEHGPLIRGRLLRLSEDRHVLLITQHHIISDGWSIGRLVDEFGKLYSAYSQGQDDPLPPLALHYADYAVWQRQWLQGEVLQHQLNYWTEQLKDAPALLELPTDRPRPVQQSYRGAGLDFSLPEPLTQALNAFSQRHQATVFMTLLAGWAILMARLSGQSDVVIGSPVANRRHADLESLIGFFVNTLPLRIRVDGQATGAQLLEQVKTITLAAYAHQDIPFEHLVEAVNPVRSLAHSPVFQIVLAYDNTPAGQALDLPGLQLDSIDQDHSTSQFDLSLSFSDTGTALTGSISYATDLFEAATIERLLGYYQTLLAGLVNNEHLAVGQLPLLGESERKQLLTTFNATDSAYPQDYCLHQLFEQHVEKTPGAIAVSYEGQSLSYGALNQRANRLAHQLIDLGVKPDSRVGLCAERSLELVVGILGILKAGGAYVPLDPNYPKARLDYLLADSAPVVLVAQAGILDWADTLTLPVVVLDGRLSEADGGQADGLWDTNPDARQLGLTPEHLAYLIYTSGSTGLPKGVMASHANVSRLMAAQSTVEHFSFSAADVWALFHSFAFDFSVWELWGALSQGARLVVVPYATSRSPSDFNRLIGEQQITVLSQTPSAYRALLEAQSQNPRGQSLRCVVLGGEALEPGLLAKARNHAPNAIIRYINGYGPTETTIFATAYGCPSEPANYIPIGYPIANSQLYVLDAQLNPVPIGVTGELYIGGAGLARGYLNRPELTAERFIANPFSADGSRLYQTGDLARWRPDGSLDYLGRNDFQVKIRGFRIELGEIEAQLQRCEGVRDAVVLAQGEGEGKRLVAYVVPKAGAELHPEALRQTLSTTLADYLIPSAFVILDNLPLTANGKLDRKALPEPDAGAVTSRVYAAPLPGTETVLAAIWQDLLHLEQVGRHDQFFELGGHSLLAVQLIARVRQALGVELAIRELFAQPTVAKFAAVIAGYLSGQQTSGNLVSIRDTGNQLPLFLVHPAGGEIQYAYDLMQHIEPDIPVYGLAASGLLEGEQPVGSVAEMAARYIECMRSVQLEGPYRVAGWSAGGTIAYEIANQLLGTEQQVEFIGLIDTPCHYAQGVEVTETDILLGYMESIASTELFEALKSLSASQDLAAMIDFCLAHGLYPEADSQASARRKLKVCQTVTQAVVDYAIYPLPVPLVLFSAGDNAANNQAWQQLARDHLKVVPLAGSHTGIVEPTNAGALGNALSNELKAASAREKSQPQAYEPLILLQNGRSETRPLFCVPGAGASVTDFYGLAMRLVEIPVYGLQPKGLEGQFVPHADVVSAANAYLQSVRKAFPNGPYRLLGHSFGGWVALEMALQLQASGESVETLILLDTEVPQFRGQAKKPFSHIEVLLELIKLFELRLESSLGLSEVDFSGLDQEQQLQLLFSHLVAAKVLPSRTALSGFTCTVRVFETNLNCHYVPTAVYRGQVQLFKADQLAEENPAASFADGYLHGWRQHAPNAIIKPLPGNHLSILTEPQVGVLAASLGVSFQTS